MDVSVRVSLQGGHVWDFACDEDDPIIHGLVSALPGVADKASLPVDGLIQVQSRDGSRIYFTRESLIAVAILARDGVRPLVSTPATAALPGPTWSTDAMLSEPAVAALSDSARTISGPGIVELEGLPDALVSELAPRTVELVRRAGYAGGLGEAMDARAHIVHGGGRIERKEPTAGHVLALVLPLGAHAAARLLIEEAGAAQAIDLQPNQGMLVAATRNPAVVVDQPAEEATVVLTCFVPHAAPAVA